MFETLTLVAKLAGMAVVGAAAIAAAAFLFRAIAAVAMASMMLNGISGRSIRNGALIGAGLGLAVATLVPGAPAATLFHWAACSAIAAATVQFIVAVVRLNLHDAHALSVAIGLADDRLARGIYSTKLYD